MEHASKVVSTGLAGLDNALNGGIPAGNQITVLGAPGTGKTLMSMQILYNCAKEDIPCALITLDQSPENVVRSFKGTFTAMGDIDRLIKNRLIAVEGYDTSSKIAANTEDESAYSMGNLVSEIDGIIKSVGAKVVVVDSLSFLRLMLGKTILYNKSVASMVSNMRRLGVTSISTLNVPYYNRERMKFSQELLLFDGILALYCNGKDAADLSMEVVKMRGSGHRRSLSGYSITQGGINFK